MKRELIIIGAGPAGLAAALEAKRQGIQDVLLLERAQRLGGILPQCIHMGFGLQEFSQELSGPEYAYRFIDALKDSGVDIRTGAMVSEVTPERYVSFSTREGFETIQARAIILAMGCRERTAGMIELMGERPAGIYHAGAAQGLINLEGKRLGTRAVIYGSGDIGLIMARRLKWEGVEVEAVIEILPQSAGLRRNIRQCLDDYGIPLYLESRITRVVGQGHIEGVEVYHARSGKTRFIPCDLLLLSVGLIPENDLVRSFLPMDPMTRGPLVDERRACEVEGFFACGNTLHVHDMVDYVSEEGRFAAQGAAAWLKGEDASLRRPILCEGNILTCVPQHVSRTDPFTLYFRVREPMEKGILRLYHGEKIILERRISYLTPSQTVRVEVPSRETEETLRMEVV